MPMLPRPICQCQIDQNRSRNPGCLGKLGDPLCVLVGPLQQKHGSPSVRFRFVNLYIRHGFLYPLVPVSTHTSWPISLWSSLLTEARPASPGADRQLIAHLLPTTDRSVSVRATRWLIATFSVGCACSHHAAVPLSSFSSA